MKGYVLVDGNSVAYAAAASRPLNVGAQQVHVVYGMLRTLRAIVNTYPQLVPVILWDGATWRKDFFKEYKASRDKQGTEEKPLTKSEMELQRVRESVRDQKKLVMEAFKLIGLTQMRAQNLEADDLAGMLCRRWKGMKIVLITGDEDWLQLLDQGVSWRDHRSDKRVSISTLKEIKGVDSGRQWLECKALMGDTSDEVPGVGGIGEKGAVELINTYGSVASFLNRINEGSIKVETLPKKFRALADDGEKQAIFTRNMRLMDLSSPYIPKPVDLRVWSKGYDRDKFQSFCRTLCFQSMLTDLDGWLSPFISRSAA
jgi:5'-3' exonuclease